MENDPLSRILHRTDLWKEETAKKQRNWLHFLGTLRHSGKSPHGFWRWTQLDFNPSSDTELALWTWASYLNFAEPVSLSIQGNRNSPSRVVRLRCTLAWQRVPLRSPSPRFWPQFPWRPLTRHQYPEWGVRGGGGRAGEGWAMYFMMRPSLRWLH